MNRLFNALKRATERGVEAKSSAPGLPGFDKRVEVLYRHAEQAAGYEDELNGHLERVLTQMSQLQELMERALDAGQDAQAYEYLRLAARFRPQRDLLQGELNAFHAVANELMRRVSLLTNNLDEARGLAANGALNPAATRILDGALNRLTRYFVMLERVSATRRRELPERLATSLMQVIDDRQLDLELAQYVLMRRRALRSGDA